MRFDRLDLNLLVALDALLTEQSVSLAADRICLSQSATSSALNRLREYFGDELLVVKGRQMVLTARAESLVEPVRQVLQQIRTTIAVVPPFDPSTSDRQIRLMASDYIIEVLLAPALNGLREVAPGMSFEILSMSSNPIDDLERRSVDMLITIDYAMSKDHPNAVLFEDDYVVVGWDRNPAMNRSMTPDLYLELGHVAARFGRGRASAFEDWYMRRQKQQRRVEIVVPTFQSILNFVIGSHRIATVHRRLADSHARYLPLTIKEVPFDIPRIRETVQWHYSNAHDPVLVWMVEQLQAAAQFESPARDNVIPVQADTEELSQQFSQHLTGGTRR